MVKIITLNEILNLAEEFVDNSNIARDFGYGPTSEIATSRQMKFPYVWATHNTDSSIRIGANKSTIPEISIMFLFVDKLNNQNNTDDNVGEGSDNGRDVMSDMLELAQDMVIDINNRWPGKEIAIKGDVDLTPMFDQTTDKVNGWGAEITFRLKYVNCNPA